MKTITHILMIILLCALSPNVCQAAEAETDSDKNPELTEKKKKKKETAAKKANKTRGTLKFVDIDTGNVTISVIKEDGSSIDMTFKTDANTEIKGKKGATSLSSLKIGGSASVHYDPETKILKKIGVRVVKGKSAEEREYLRKKKIEAEQKTPKEDDSKQTEEKQPTH